MHRLRSMLYERRIVSGWAIMYHVKSLRRTVSADVVTCIILGGRLSVRTEMGMQRAVEVLEWTLLCMSL